MEKKNLDQHKEYLKETVKLSLWVTANWKNNHTDDDFLKIIDERSALVNHTVFNPKELYDEPTFFGNEWPLLKEQLKNIYEKNNSPEVFESEGFKLVEPYIYGRAERDLKIINNDTPANSDSWIRYDLNSTEEFLEIHMENSRYPDSFLADDEYFYSKLQVAVQEAEEKGFKGLRTVSWLNDLPAWQNKMPKEWNESIKDRTWDIEWHLGFWGQFLTSNQCFNHRAGEKFRKDGKVTYPMSKAQGTIQNFKDLLGELECLQ